MAVKITHPGLGSQTTLRGASGQRDRSRDQGRRWRGLRLGSGSGHGAGPGGVAGGSGSGLSGNHEDKYKNRTPWRVRSTASIVIIERTLQCIYVAHQGFLLKNESWLGSGSGSTPTAGGRATGSSKGFTQTSSRQILDFFGCLRFGLPKRFLPTPRNRDFMAHVTGQLILYFQANGRRRVPETLVKIDIDCHSRGSFRGGCPSAWSG